MSSFHRMSPHKHIHETLLETNAWARNQPAHTCLAHRALTQQVKCDVFCSLLHCLDILFASTGLPARVQSHEGTCESQLNLVRRAYLKPLTHTHKYIQDVRRPRLESPTIHNQYSRDNAQQEDSKGRKNMWLIQRLLS